LADRVRAFFPALLLVERLKPEGRGSTDCDGGGRWGTAPERLGEDRIPRENGRGGLGGGYQARPGSPGPRGGREGLGPPGGRGPRRLLRFRREARTAAQLHHTNIVPVFGVGESGGTHYYVMQFIPGLGLDAVMKEVRRLRGMGPELGKGTAALDCAPAATDVA